MRYCHYIRVLVERLKFPVIVLNVHEVLMNKHCRYRSRVHFKKNADENRLRSYYFMI
jgi:hypothetical protein